MSLVNKTFNTDADWDKAYEWLWCVQPHTPESCKDYFTDIDLNVDIASEYFIS